MAFSVSSRALRNTPRYAVVRRMVDGTVYAAPTLDGTQYTEYCETFADVKAHLHAEGMAGCDGRFYWVRQPAHWFADAVQTVCRIRRQAFVVAKATNGTRTEWLSVLAL